MRFVLSRRTVFQFDFLLVESVEATEDVLDCFLYSGGVGRCLLRMTSTMTMISTTMPPIAAPAAIGTTEPPPPEDARDGEGKRMNINIKKKKRGE